MDFDIIESLSEKELSELYNETLYMSDCKCITQHGFIINFGHHLWTIFDTCSGYGCCGYCDLNLRYFDDCNNWCSRFGFSVYFFSHLCTCTNLGKARWNNWDDCFR